MMEMKCFNIYQVIGQGIGVEKFNEDYQNDKQEIF